MSKFWPLLFFVLGTPLLGQPLNPRIRIRVVDDNGEPALRNTELSNNVYVDEIGSTTKSQLDRTSQLLEAEQYPESLDMLTRLLEVDLRTLSEVDQSEVSNGIIRYTPLSNRLSELADRLVAGSEEEFSRFQDQIDPLARRWYEEAKRTRTDGPLHRILHEAPRSRIRLPALQLLGDRSLERGHFFAARRYYRRMAESLDWQNKEFDRRLPFWIRAKRGSVPSGLVKQISKITDPRRFSALGSVWARLTLVSVLEGNRERANAELAILKRGWPQARGKLGGVEGFYVERLSELLTDSRTWDSQTQLNSAATAWPTFAGNESRNWVGSVEIDIPLEPAWRVPLKKIDPADPVIQRQYGLPSESAGELSNRPCTYFPIVVGETILIKEETKLRALDIRTGKATWSRREDGQFFANTDYVRSPAVTFGQQSNVRLGQLRFLMSSADGLAVATFGARQGVGRIRDSALVGFNLQSQGAIQFGPVLAESAQWSFHSAPLNDGNRCWVGKRLADSTTQDYLACYDVSSGKELWQTRICSAEGLGQGSVGSTSNFVLTKHEDTVYVSSHLGTIAALHAETGTIRWLVKYQRKGPKQGNLSEPNWFSTRELTPCLIYGDLVIVAPSDSDKVFALTQDNGIQIWSTSVPNDATQMLGLSQDHQLILSGRRVWWLDAFTGQASRKVAVNPFPADPTSEPKGVGRGLLSGGNVYWPAVEDEKSKIYVLDQRTGRQKRQAIDLSADTPEQAKAAVEAGNLILTKKHLLIASPEELVAYELSN